MNCFCTSQAEPCGDCCHANELCRFSGNLEDVTTAPIYVQSVYDAVRFHLRGMKTVQNLKFTPAIPCGCTVSKILGIRCKKVFNPDQSSDCDNLTLDLETGISGAYFVNDCNGVTETIGPDGVPSEKILFADTSNCDENNAGTPIFGTQNVRMWGNIIIYLDLCICDSCGHESTITVCAEVNIAKSSHPLVLTNFFELCMPSTGDSACMPRLAELSNAGFNVRLATNNISRDLCVCSNGEISGNLIIQICVTIEKKIIVPVQLCVLTTGFAEAPLQESNSGVVTCPGLFPERTERSSSTSSQTNCNVSCASDPGCDSGCAAPVEDCGCGCSDYPPQQCR